MEVMAKKNPQPEPPQEPEPEPSKRPPSREKLRYVAIPIEMHAGLIEYARQHSDEDEDKSISWAARRAVREFLLRNKLWPPQTPPAKE